MWPGTWKLGLFTQELKSTLHNNLLLSEEKTVHILRVTASRDSTTAASSKQFIINLETLWIVHLDFLALTLKKPR